MCVGFSLHDCYGSFRDHLTGGRAQQVSARRALGRHREVERFRRLEIDHEFNLGALLYCKVGRVGTLESFSGVGAYLQIGPRTFPAGRLCDCPCV
jgi:hypothetical protein